MPRRQAPRPSVQGASLPAPLGVNLVDTAGALPAGDCLGLVNVIRAELGLRTRSGYREWVTGLGGEVRSVLPFQGSQGDGSEDRLFAATSHGIWDCSASTDAPTEVFAFPSSSGSAGRGVGRGFVTVAGGHYLLYCDEENGYIHYNEAGSGTWTLVPAGGGAGEINGADPRTFAFVTAWKNRLWFVQKDSQIGWYLPVNSLTGTVARFDFGPQFKRGGTLVGLFSCTLDGGAGIDDLLVAISSAGDVVIYQGTDPASASTFALKGIWYVGAVPAGRRIATDDGGDLLILSSLGVLPLSKLVAGAAIADQDAYSTRKIAPVIGRLMTERGASLGWDVFTHPEDKTLVVNTPAVPGVPREQWAMSIAARGWAQHTGVPMASSAAWKGKLYFGAADGRVCLNDGDVDNAQLGSSASAIAIDSQMLTDATTLGTPKRKRLSMARPKFVTAGTPPQYAIAARVDFDRSELAAVSYVAPAGAGIWDSSAWNSGIWGTGVGTAGEWRGLAGMGANVAVALRMSTKARTTLVGLDVLFDAGGAL